MLLFLLFFQSCAAPTQPVSRSQLVLGTLCTVTIYDKPSDRAFRDVFARLNEIHNLMAADVPESDVYRLNHAQAGEFTRLSTDTMFVLRKALDMAARTDGLFDPAIGPLVALWGIGSETAAVPDRAALEACLPLLDWRNIEIHPHEDSAALGIQGMKVDLGAIAKGYAADEAKKVLLKGGVKQAIIDLGGNILVMGEKPDGSPFKVGVQNPEAARGGAILAVELRETALVTSGIYERFFIEDGKHYHHILNAKTGYPVENSLASVTIITADAALADALSTAVFAMGRDAGAAFIEDLPDCEAVFVSRSGEVKLTSGFAAGTIPYRQLNPDFPIIP